LYVCILKKKEMQPMELEDKEPKAKEKTWIKRIGFVGFCFFLGKGLVWIAVFFGLFKGCS
jgi:hypothetical protein